VDDNADIRVGGGVESGLANPAVSRIAGPGLAVPLTERILSRLPGPRLAWVVGWALIPWVNLVVVVVLGAGEWARPGVPLSEVLNRVAVSFAVTLSLWGTARITDELRGLGRDVAKVVEQEQTDVERLLASPGYGDRPKAHQTAGAPPMTTSGAPYDSVAEAARRVGQSAAG
jgi:hypothetical protein